MWPWSSPGESESSQVGHCQCGSSRRTWGPEEVVVSISTASSSSNVLTFNNNNFFRRIEVTTGKTPDCGAIVHHTSQY